MNHSQSDYDVQCKVDFIPQLATTSPVVGLRRNEVPEHFPKPKLHQKKKSHGHYLVVCCPSNPLQLSESQWNHYIWEVSSANRWDALKIAMAVLVNRMGAILQKLNKLVCKVLPHPPYSPDLWSTNYHFFKHLNNLLLQAKCFHN